MSTKRFTRAALAVAASVALVSLSACSTPTDSGGDTAGESGAYTAAEVAAASGTYEVVPLFAVPKNIENLQLAFLSPSTSYPFFAAWSQGMKDAAAFYGVSLDEYDLAFKYENALTGYEQVSIKQPVIVGGGAGAMNEPTIAAAAANSAKVVVIDQVIDGAADFGVADEQVGQLAVTSIADAVNTRLSGDWEGRDLVVAGLTSAGCAPCDARVNASFDQAVETFGVNTDDTFRLEPVNASDPTTDATTVFTDFLTAHPNDVVVVSYAGDAAAIGVANAARAANREGDVLVMASGGDETARAALRDPANAGILVGAVDFQPYSEGWNWVEAAIATYLDQSFAPYEVTRVLTSDNVDTLYPED